MVAPLKSGKPFDAFDDNGREWNAGNLNKTLLQLNTDSKAGPAGAAATATDFQQATDSLNQMLSQNGHSSVLTQQALQNGSLDPADAAHEFALMNGYAFNGESAVNSMLDDLGQAKQAGTISDQQYNDFKSQLTQVGAQANEQETVYSKDAAQNYAPSKPADPAGTMTLAGDRTDLTALQGFLGPSSDTPKIALAGSTPYLVFGTVQKDGQTMVQCANPYSADPNVQDIPLNSFAREVSQVQTPALAPGKGPVLTALDSEDLAAVSQSTGEPTEHVSGITPGVSYQFNGYKTDGVGGPLMASLSPAPPASGAPQEISLHDFQAAFGRGPI